MVAEAVGSLVMTMSQRLHGARSLPRDQHYGAPRARATPRLGGELGGEALRQRQRYVPKASTGCIGDGIGNRRSSWPLCRFTRTEERRPGLIEYMNLEVVRNFAKAQDGIAAPVAARDSRAIKRNALMERPACRLQDSALDLVRDAVRVHRFTTINRRDHTLEPHAAAIPVNLNFCGQREIRGEIFVSRKGKTATTVLPPLVVRPAETLSGHLDDRLCPRIIQMAEPEIDRIGSRN